ncbi:MAG: T9SS type A sorting domain-containing protein [candidate division Zixibacteria bacterium]|nr:T9SS type A sorting domain-containing protein [candidate division Zixibacteria bacterium]
MSFDSRLSDEYAAGQKKSCVIKCNIDGDTYIRALIKSPDDSGLFPSLFPADHHIIPTTSALRDNYPNPFNDITIIPFDLTESSIVTLNIYNISGGLIEILLDDYIDAGIYTVRWDATDYSSGIYFYKLTINNKTLTKRMTLLK